MSAGRGTITMQRLGVRLIEQRNPDDAIVLGDAMLQAGIDGLITGRSRPVQLRTAMTASHAPDRALASITTRPEQAVIVRTALIEPRFIVQAYEVIYNVEHFAASPTREQWDKIWTMWVTPRRATYQALVTQELLPRSIRFAELQWKGMLRPPPGVPYDDIALAYALFVERVPPRRKRAIQAYLFNVMRLDSDNPRAHTVHFDEAT